MKKRLFLITLSVLLTNVIFAQGTHILTGGTKGDHFFVATLPKTDLHNHQKLKIEIFGGNWYNYNLGTRTYSISSRNGNGAENRVIINQEQRGGGTANYALKVYETNSGYDFVIEATSLYISIFVQAWLGQDNKSSGMAPITAQQITKYNPGVNKDVTSQVVFNTIFATDQAGNIGIGTLTPQARLDVRGKIVADEVQIKVNTGADFVFEPDYKLRSLDEVEDFLKKNKHLPEIPSEKQMQKEGLNVNDMQIKLLQKIEELTLYVIDQNKRIEKQDKTIQELQLQINATN